MSILNRTSIRDARGFTLVELLLILLIIGILAVIALPAFIGQRAKGHDVEAQQTLRTAATALATYHIDNDTFGATRAELEAIEPALGEASADLDIVGGADTFTIAETSVSGTEFVVERASDGTVTRSCTVAGRGLCRTGNRW